MRLFLFPDPVEIPAGETALIEVWLDTEGQSINAAKVLLQFPPNALSVDEVITGGSVLPLTPELPFIGLDTVRIIGGAPSGYTGSGVLARLVVRAPEQPRVDTVTISFTADTMVLLNDGLATPALVSARPTNISFVVPGPIEVSSSSHPDSTRWYQGRIVVLHWDVEEGAAYSYQISRDPALVPDDVSNEPVGDIKLATLEDGIYYFALRKVPQNDAELPDDTPLVEEPNAEPSSSAEAAAGRRNAEEAVTRHRVMVDGTPPEPFEVVVTQQPDVFAGDFWYAAFTPHDALSGIARIEVAEVIGDLEPQWFETASPYVLRDQARNAVLFVRATDRAGNVYETMVEPIEEIGRGAWLFGAFLVFAALVAVIQRRRSLRGNASGIISGIIEEKQPETGAGVPRPKIG